MADREGIINLSGFKDRIKMLTKDSRGEMLRQAAEAGALFVEGQARINAARTFTIHPMGNLMNNITHSVEVEGNTAKAEIGPQAVYGRIHELGGVIRPTRAKMLHWIGTDGKHHFAKAVHMPARPYLRPAIADHEDEIKHAIEITVANYLASKGL